MQRAKRPDDEAFNVVLPSELNRSLGIIAAHLRLSKREIVERAILEKITKDPEFTGLLTSDQRSRLGLLRDTA